MLQGFQYNCLAASICYVFMCAMIHFFNLKSIHALTFCLDVFVLNTSRSVYCWFAFRSVILFKLKTYPRIHLNVWILLLSQDSFVCFCSERFRGSSLSTRLYGKSRRGVFLFHSHVLYFLFLNNDIFLIDFMDDANK